MRSPNIDDFVRLTQDIPQLALQRGDIGIVRSTWFAPALAYEVEFHSPGTETRALLQAEQMEVETDPPPCTDASVAAEMTEINGSSDLAGSW
jgi:hypothetical protein